MFGGTRTVGAHGAQTVSIVNQDAELKLFFQSHDFVQFTQVAGHAVHAFGNHQHAAALLVGEFASHFQLFAQAVHNAGVGLGVIHNDIAAGCQHVDDGNHTLIAKVK